MWEALVGRVVKRGLLVRAKGGEMNNQKRTMGFLFYQIAWGQDYYKTGLVKVMWCLASYQIGGNLLSFI